MCLFLLMSIMANTATRNFFVVYLLGGMVVYFAYGIRHSKLAQGEVVIDPFTGHSLSRDELDELLAPYKRHRGLQGDFDAPLGLFLQTATARDVLARMLRNLKDVHRSAGEAKRLLAVQQRLVVLLPRAWEERRDRGLVCAELGLVDAATCDLAAYLEHVPAASDRALVEAQLLALGRGDASSLH